MSEEQSGRSRIVGIDLRPWAIREIRRRAALEGGIIVASDIRARAAELGLFSFDIPHILRTGRFAGEPLSQPEGGYLCRMTQRVRKRRAFVDVVIYGEDGLFVKQCDWEGDP